MSTHVTTRKLALLMTALAVVPLAASCAQESASPTEAPTTAVSATTDSSTPTTTPQAQPNLDSDMNFGGYRFRIVTNEDTSPDGQDWVPRDIFAEEENADPINDAVYRRNRTLEERYGFILEQVKKEDQSDFVKKSIQSGLNDFDVIEAGMGSFITDGLLMDLYDLPDIDFEQPWWNQSANAQLSIANRLFTTDGGAMQLINMDASAAILFNKGLLQGYLFTEDPYELVNSGKWTMDKFGEMIRAGTRDIDGNQIMNYQTDSYGLIFQRDTAISLLHNSGETIAAKDSDDLPYVNVGSERSILALEKAFDIMYDHKTAFNMHTLEGLETGIYPESEAMFEGGRGLFMWIRFRIVQNLRNMDTDFGILPIPKLDEKQENYYSTVNVITGKNISVPKTSDPDRTGFILEAICAESLYTLTPAYYEITLKTKIARDDESQTMLDIIFDGMVFDIGAVYNWGGFHESLIYGVMSDNRRIISNLDKAKTAMQRQVDAMVNKILALE
ncbi:hypothetical protein FACS1894219_07160 [Clostridia bacterium]|nr:hypothetical protein FACS1894219_07160 [Clostridia bacterium]